MLTKTNMDTHQSPPITTNYHHNHHHPHLAQPSTLTIMRPRTDLTSIGVDELPKDKPALLVGPHTVSSCLLLVSHLRCSHRCGLCGTEILKGACCSKPATTASPTNSQLMLQMPASEDSALPWKRPQGQVSPIKKSCLNGLSIANR